MKILHIIWSFATGGIETMLVDIANEQSSSNNVSIFCINDCVEESLKAKLKPNIFFKSFDRKLNSRSLLPWIKLNWHVYKFRPDIIHFHMGGIAKYVFFKAPRLRTVHNTHAPLSDLKYYDKICAISCGVKRYIQYGGIEDVTVVYNGIRPDLIKKKVTDISTSMKMVCVGRLHPDKGQTVLIKAIKNLLEKHNIKDFHLDIIGEGPSKKEISELIKDYKLENYITLCGWRDRFFIYNHLCDYDLYILPSVSEGFGLTLAEAVCSKIPVITSKLEGPMEIINEGRLGCYFEVGNYLDLAEKIKEIIMNGVDKEMINNAYKFAIENFDVTITAQKYKNIYNQTEELWRKKRH